MKELTVTLYNIQRHMMVARVDCRHGLPGCAARHLDVAIADLNTLLKQNVNEEKKRA